MSLSVPFTWRSFFFKGRIQSDLVGFTQLPGPWTLDSAGLTWIPKRPGERARLPAVPSAVALFGEGGSFPVRHSFERRRKRRRAPGATADALVPRRERVRASSPPSFPPRPEQRKPQSLEPAASSFPRFPLSRFSAFRFSAICRRSHGLNPSARSFSAFRPAQPSRTVSHGDITMSTPASSFIFHNS